MGLENRSYGHLHFSCLILWFAAPKLMLKFNYHCDGVGKWRCITHGSAILSNELMSLEEWIHSLLSSLCSSALSFPSTNMIEETKGSPQKMLAS